MRTADLVMRAAPVIPVLVVEEVAGAAPLADALAGGGLTTLEVTLRTPAALEAIREMAEACPQATVGAGTVLNPRQMEAAVRAGARFIVSPGITEALVRAAQSLDVPLLPGAVTASEILIALELGLDRLKFFPAEAAGGVRTLEALQGPFPDILFCPTGGVDLEAARTYLELPNVLCVGGSWVAPKDAVRSGDWARIRRLAEDARRLGSAARPGG